MLSEYWQPRYVTHKKNSVSGWCFWRDVCIAFCVDCTFCRLAYSSKTVWSSLQVEIPQGVSFFIFLSSLQLELHSVRCLQLIPVFRFSDFERSTGFRLQRKFMQRLEGAKGCGNEIHRSEAKRRSTDDVYNSCCQSISCHNSHHLRILRNPRRKDGQPRGNFLARK